MDFIRVLVFRLPPSSGRAPSSFPLSLSSIWSHDHQFLFIRSHSHFQVNPTLPPRSSRSPLTPFSNACYAPDLQNPVAATRHSDQRTRAIWVIRTSFLIQVTAMHLKQLKCVVLRSNCHGGWKCCQMVRHLFLVESLIHRYSELSSVGRAEQRTRTRHGLIVAAPQFCSRLDFM